MDGLSGPYVGKRLFPENTLLNRRSGFHQNLLRLISDGWGYLLLEQSCYRFLGRHFRGRILVIEPTLPKN